MVEAENLITNITRNNIGQEETNLIFKNAKDKTTEYNLEISKKINDNKSIKNIVSKYQDESNKVEATIQQEIEIVNNFTNEIILNDENSINLSKLEAESVEAILDRVNSSVAERGKEITTIVNIEDLWKILKVTRFIKEEQILGKREVTRTERNRLNSKSEILQGAI